jgi:catechol O-methyltransferase|tara:strand:+ start:1439 stop:2176 length:738 start_codon:yes stop_codon:yes gene_type:complete
MKALPWGLRIAARMLRARIRGEAALHDAVLEYVRCHAREGDPDAVLACLDRFAREKRFLMNVGDEKGPLLEELVASRGTQARIIELGSFVGYSAVLMSRLLGSPGDLFSVDVDQNATRVSSAVARHAGVGDRTTFLNGTLEQVLGQGTHGLDRPFDIVFLDHWKSAYQADAQRLLEHELIAPDGIVIADNLGTMFGHNDYVDWMLARDDFESTFIDAHVEYSNLKDRVMISRRQHTGASNGPSNT